MYCGLIFYLISNNLFFLFRVGSLGFACAYIRGGTLSVDSEGPHTRTLKKFFYCGKRHIM